MKKKILLLSLLLAATSYANEGDFYEEAEVKESSVRLEESVVSTTGYETTIRNTAKNVQIVSSEEIEEKNYTDVSEVLKDSPMVNIREDQFGPIVEMRGSGVNSKATVQVLVDGVNINPVDINHGTLPLNAIPISSVEKIEILPGGSGVLYGDGATGGVINIITKAVASGEPSTYVGGRYGSYDEKIIEAGAGTKIGEDLLLQVNYSGSDRDGNRKDEYTDKQYVDISAKYDLTKDDKITFKYAHTEKNSTSADMLTKDELNEDRDQSGIDYEGKYSDVSGNGDIADKSKLVRDELYGNYEKKIGEKLTFNLMGSYQKSVTDSHTRDLNTKNIGGFNWIDYYADTIGTFTDEKFKINPSLKYDYMDKSYFIAGYDYKLQNSKRDFDNFGDMYKVYKLDSEKESHGGYFFNKTTLGKVELIQGFRREWTNFDVEKTTHYYHQVLPGGGHVDGGLQMDIYTKNMTNDAYEFATNYLYSDTGNLYARYEQSFRTPAPTEFQDKDGQNYKINDLDAEVNQSMELGFNDYIGSSFVSANIFHTLTKNEIYYDEITHGQEWYYSNLDETIRTGIEGSAEQYFGKFTVFEKVSYIDTKITENSQDRSIEGNEVPYASKVNANAGLKYDYNKNLNSIFSINYRSKYYVDKANTHRAEDTITADLTVNYKFENGLKVYGGIKNLFDRNNYDRVGLENGEMVYDPANGRTYHIGFRYTI